MKKSTSLRKAYEKDLERAETINELVWISTTFKQDMNISCDDLLSLCRQASKKRIRLEKTGQKYTRATRPSWK